MTILTALGATLTLLFTMLCTMDTWPSPHEFEREKGRRNLRFHLPAAFISSLFTFIFAVAMLAMRR
jgi:hypothetical protein